MRKFEFLFLTVFLVISCNSGNEIGNSAAIDLQISINSYENHKGYDRKEYPLGLHTKAYYKQEADFAKKELDILEIIHKLEISIFQPVQIIYKIY